MAVTPRFENMLFFPPPHLQVLITHSWIKSILQWRHCRRSQRPQSFLMSSFFALSRHFKRSFQFQVVEFTNISVFNYAMRPWTQLYLHLKVILQTAASIHPSINGARAPSGPGPPSEDASILLCFLLVSFILVFLGPAMCLSGRLPPILFLVFLLVLYYKIPPYEPFWDISSSILIIRPVRPSLLNWISSIIFRSLYKL